MCDNLVSFPPDPQEVEYVTHIYNPEDPKSRCEMETEFPAFQRPVFHVHAAANK